MVDNQFPEGGDHVRFLFLLYPFSTPTPVLPAGVAGPPLRLLIDLKTLCHSLHSTWHVFPWPECFPGFLSLFSNQVCPLSHSSLLARSFCSFGSDPQKLNISPVKDYGLLDSQALKPAFPNLGSLDVQGMGRLFSVFRKLKRLQCRTPLQRSSTPGENRQDLILQGRVVEG